MSWFVPGPETGCMPTASEFRHLAGVLDDARLELAALPHRLRLLTGDLVLTRPAPGGGRCDRRGLDRQHRGGDHRSFSPGDRGSPPGCGL